MVKKVLLVLVLLAILVYMLLPGAQTFPVQEWLSASHDKPAVFYITGDGGLNKFSTALCESLNKKGYDVFALNAKSYFWHSRTPAQASDDVNNYLAKTISGRSNPQLVFIGYSFGADVLPFIINRLPKNVQEKIKASFLIGSSGSTDFEIHLSDFFGKTTKRSMDVIPEINKLPQENVVIINGREEDSLAANKIILKKYFHEVLPGDHHFGGKTEEVTNAILKHI